MAEKMLVIDDEKFVLESCRRIFAKEGYEVITTDDPQQGLNMLEQTKFDVILTDWKMPTLDGLDLVAEIGKKSPDSTVVMFSGYPSVERATEALKRGAMDYVAKPFTPDEILDVVKRAERRKIAEERKSLGKIEKIVGSISFPVPSFDDIAPRTIAETVAQKIGVGKITSPWLSVLVLGILAGAYIGFGGMLSTTVTFDLPARMGIGFSRFMAGAVFSTGLMLVVIAGAELFTGNNLMISSAISGQIAFGRMLERWGLVYVANFIGSIVVALLFTLSGVWKMGESALGAAAVNIAYAKVSLSFLQALVRAIGCNWLVCLAVWMALASRQTVGKIFAIFFPIMAFVALGFEHSVANMYFIPVGIFLRLAGVPAPSAYSPEALSWLSFLWDNLVPVTLGNIIGGGVFVGMSYWSAYLRQARS